MLAGKTINSTTSEWNNNRLVLVFEKEKEIGRTTTFRGEFAENELGIIDGLFVVEIPNTYRFTIKNFEENQVPLDFHMTDRPDGFLKNRKIIYHWYPEFIEGNWTGIFMKSKNMYYIIYVLSGDISTLPPEIVGGKTEFKKGVLVVVPPEVVPAEVDQAIEGEYLFQDIVYKTSVENVVLEKITIPIDNCKSDIAIKTPYSYSRTYIHKYIQEDTVGGGLNISIPKIEWAKIVFELKSKYGFEDEQVNTSTITYDLAANPYSYQFYTITGTEIWENGLANVVKDNQPISVPFRVKTNLIYQISSETRQCP